MNHEPTRKCKQCVRDLPISNFREYHYKAKGSIPARYHYCKDCEYINTAYRKAKKDNDLQAVTKLKEVFQLQIERGGIIPKFGGEKITSRVDTMKDTLSAQHPLFIFWTTEYWLSTDLSVFDFDTLSDYVQGPLKDKMVRQVGVSTSEFDDYGLPTILYDEPDYSLWKKINQRVLELW